MKEWAARACWLAALMACAGIGPALAQENNPPPGIAGYHEIVERPLFTPSRRPAPQAAVQVDAAPESMVLMGVIVLPTARYAVIKEGTAPARSVVEGAQVAAGMVERIMPQGITLHTADGSVLAMPVPAAGDKGTAQIPPAAGSPDGPHAARPVIGKEKPTIDRAHDQAALGAAPRDGGPGSP